MKVRLWFAVLLSCAMFLATTPLHAQGQDDEKKKFEAYMKKYGAPGKEHKYLQPMVGKFKVKATMWMQPGAEPDVSDAVSQTSWILGKRFLMQRYKGKALGMSFEGFGVTGYDRKKKKYTGSWCDNMGTMTLHNEGTYDRATKTFTFTSVYDDPFTGMKYKGRDIIRIRNKNEHVFEMYRAPADAADAKYSKVLELRYTRDAKKKKKKQ